MSTVIEILYMKTALEPFHYAKPPSPHLQITSTILPPDKFDVEQSDIFVSYNEFGLRGVSTNDELDEILGTVEKDDFVAVQVLKSSSDARLLDANNPVRETPDWLTKLRLFEWFSYTM